MARPRPRWRTPERRRATRSRRCTAPLNDGERRHGRLATPPRARARIPVAPHPTSRLSAFNSSCADALVFTTRTGSRTISGRCATGRADSSSRRQPRARHCARPSHRRRERARRGTDAGRGIAARATPPRLLPRASTPTCWRRAGRARREARAGGVRGVTAFRANIVLTASGESGGNRGQPPRRASAIPSRSGVSRGTAGSRVPFPRDERANQAAPRPATVSTVSSRLAHRRPLTERRCG